LATFTITITDTNIAGKVAVDISTDPKQATNEQLTTALRLGLYVQRTLNEVLEITNIIPEASATKEVM
jgi:uncharacterized protein YhaN